MSSSPVAAAEYVAQVRARLTGPGGPFELADVDVRGTRIPVFAHRARSLSEHVERSAALGDREYLVDGSTRITFAEHRDSVAALAHTLRERGVEPGDRVMILASNSAEWVVSFWAIAATGAITVAGNAWWTAREAEYAIGHCSPRFVIADARRTAMLPAKTPVITIDDIAAVIVAGSAAPLDQPAADEDSPAVIMYTSGTTGHPKGATHSHRNLLSVIEYHRLNDALATAMGAPPELPRRCLMSLPLFHIASLHNLAIPRLVLGDTVVIDHGRFDVDRVFSLIESERITNWAIVPTMAHRVASHPDLERYDLSSLTAVSVNSAPSSPALKQRLKDAVPSVQQSVIDSYGLTESSTAVTVASPLDLMAHPATVGRPIAGVTLEIRDVDGNEVPDGVEGEICTRSAYVMLGYWADADATARAITDDGWLRTGDIGFVQDGFLYMSTRRSDLILRGGENVYPAEIEAVLGEHPAVLECAVFGVDHTDLGQEVVTVIVTSGETSEDELRAYVAERLAYYKVPSQWRLTSEPLPKTATGKIVRSTLTI